MRIGTLLSNLYSNATQENIDNAARKKAENLTLNFFILQASMHSSEHAFQTDINESLIISDHGIFCCKQNTLEMPALSLFFFAFNKLP
ncbi:MAG: hypothetical protein DRR06_05585 [Gammaproteobacteria bacterium]|nr:MAG: hypothetical protein DRR06_05585 [Gammaproteobacteria bacterium]RLA54784.1 MAG: hypothetical protein DRR42_00635 [Gammaproteobacteria bacterium]